MKKIYYYNSDMLLFPEILMYFCWTGVVLAWAPLAIGYFMIGVLFWPPLRFGIGMSMACLCAGLLLRILVRDGKQVSYIVTDDAFIKESRYRTIGIPFVNVTGASCRRTWYARGIRLTLRSDEHTIAVTSAVRNLASLIDTLHERMRNTDCTKAMTADAFISCRREAMLCDCGAENLHDVRHLVLWLPIAFFFGGWGLAHGLWGFSLSQAMLWGGISAFCGLGAIFGGNIHLNARLMFDRSPDPMPLPLHQRRNIRLIWALIAIVLYIVAGILFKHHWAF